MKFCEAHTLKIKQALWRKGEQSLPPDQAAKRELETGKPDVMGRVTQLLYSSIAEEFPASVIAAPTEACPMCLNPKLEVWIDKAVHNVVWHKRAGDLADRPKEEPTE